jgi:hypothetical protein
MTFMTFPYMHITYFWPFSLPRYPFLFHQLPFYIVLLLPSPLFPPKFHKWEKTYEICLCENALFRLTWWSIVLFIFLQTFYYLWLDKNSSHKFLYVRKTALTKKAHEKSLMSIEQSLMAGPNCQAGWGKDGAAPSGLGKEWLF